MAFLAAVRAGPTPRTTAGPIASATSTAPVTMASRPVPPVARSSRPSTARVSTRSWSWSPAGSAASSSAPADSCAHMAVRRPNACGPHRGDRWSPLRELRRATPASTISARSMPRMARRTARRRSRKPSTVTACACACACRPTRCDALAARLRDATRDRVAHRSRQLIDGTTRLRALLSRRRAPNRHHARMTTTTHSQAPDRQPARAVAVRAARIAVCSSRWLLALALFVDGDAEPAGRVPAA